MPFGALKPQCKFCESNSTTIWRRIGPGEYICQTCYVDQESNKNEDYSGIRADKIGTRQYKITRIKSVRNKTVSKGKNRRSFYKVKPATKPDSLGCTNVTSEFIIYKGQYFQCGDIVSVIDAEDHQKYYAQCNAFMTDEFCQKFVSFTWLLPIKRIDPNIEFDPSLFYIGPSDELIHNMESVEFECHAPADYFKPQKSIFPTFPTSQSKNFISVNMT